MHSPSRLEASVWEIVEGNCHASVMDQNLCRLLRSVNCMSLSTQLVALVYLLSRCYAPVAYPECCRQNTTAISHTLDRCAPSGCHSWLSFITVIIQAHPSLLPEHQVVWNLTYALHAFGPQLLRWKCVNMHLQNDVWQKIKTMIIWKNSNSIH